MTAQDKLNKASRAHGWANWSEVLMHNAPAHVINLIVEEAMRGEKVIAVENTEPALAWRPGARVRLNKDLRFSYLTLKEGEEFIVQNKDGFFNMWMCLSNGFWCYLRESDAVVVG